MRWGLISGLCSIMGFVGGVVLLGTGFVLYTQFENIFGNTVRNQMYIDDSVYWWYDVWLQSPGKETLTVHIFAVENSAEWRKNPSRTRPQLRLVGPFVFRVQRTKEKVNFTAEDHQQITYEERTVYQFDELLSYESLDGKATVANAELMVLNPFILAMTRRATSVKAISKGLNSTINQILRIYEANLFIERPVERIIFGPSGMGADRSNGPLPTMPEVPIDPGDGADFSGAGNDSLALARLQMDGAASLGPGNTAGIEDQATVEILKLYDKAATYFERLGVEINPYDLLAAQMGKKVVKVGKSARLQDPATEQPYRFNSMMAFFQNNSLQKFDLFTGRESNQNGKIIRWNNQNKLDAWFSRTCNEINGTDGRQFGPFVRARRLYEFNPKVCRSVPMQLRDQSVTKDQGINYFRYVRASDFMQSPVKSTANGCYCRWWVGGKGKALVANNKRCNYDGILDLGTCYSGTSAAMGEETVTNTSTPHSSPVILSNPHFSGTITKSITREVGGLLPDSKIYSSYIDVEPVSGVVLQRSNKFQFNLHIRPLPLQLRSNRTLRELIIPLFWYEELWQLSTEQQNHIKYFFVYPLKYQELAIFALVGAGILSLGWGAICLFVCCCIAKKKNNITTKTTKSSGKVSPSQPPVEEMQPDGAVPPLDPYEDELGIGGPIATYGNQWGVNGGPNRGYPAPPPPEDGYGDEMMMLGGEADPMMAQGGQPNYFDNANYIDDQLAQQNATMTPNGLPMMPPQGQMNGRMTQTMGRIQQQPNGYGAQQQPQYPLERLKRNMPAKQSASTYSMRTLQPRAGAGGGGQQQMQGQMPPQQRQRWGEQPPGTTGYEEMTSDPDEYDMYNGEYDIGKEFGNESEYYDYRNDSGNDSMQSGPGRQANNAIGFYETYDEYGNPRPPPTEPGIEIYQNNAYGGGRQGIPPPPPPPTSRANGVAPRDNLMAEIRNGTKLRKTSTPKDVGIPIEDLITATSTAVVKQVLEHLKQRQQIPRPPPPTEPRTLDLELLAKIITNAPAAQTPVKQAPTNNFIININGGPQTPMGAAGSPWNDPQLMSYIQSLMYPGYQQAQQPALTYPQQLALMGLIQPALAGAGAPGTMATINSLMQMGGYYPPALPAPIQTQPQPMPGFYPVSGVQPPFYVPSGGQFSEAQHPQQVPAPPIAQVAIQETQMLMQQQQPQQQQIVYQRFEARSNVEQDKQERESRQTFVKSPSPMDEPPYIESPESTVTGKEMSPPAIQLPGTLDSVTSEQQQQQQGGNDSIRFYGPYRAYYEPPGSVTRVRSRNRTATRRPITGGWDTSFEDEDSDDQPPTMQVATVGKQQKKYV